MEVIRLKNVWKIFAREKERWTTLKERFANLGKNKKEKVVALQNINLAIRRGECFGILGKNGSGKTTLLKIIAGILKPSKGEVYVEGKLVPILTLGLGFQRELTAKENIYIYASVFGLKNEEIDERYEEIVRFSELENLMDVKLKEFSDGMIMRLAFSVAFHVDADIILIDEVFSVGDASFQVKCLEKIKELKERGKTILLVSHSPEIIKKFCDRAIILEKGKIKACGEAKNVCEKYEEIIESERLKRWNKIVEKESKLKFLAKHEEMYVLKRGEKCKIDVEIRENLETIEIVFRSDAIHRIFSKNKEKKRFKIEIDSLPLPQGEYEVWIKNEKKTFNMKPFKIIVKGGKEEKYNKAFVFPLSSLPFQKITIVIGNNPEEELKSFEMGKPLFVFTRIENVKDDENACMFIEKNVEISGKWKDVKMAFINKVWKELALKYFKDVLMKINIGREMLEYG